MKLVIGGAFQGKKKYAQTAYQIEAGWADGRVCSPDALWTCQGIYDFHEYVRRMLREPDFFHKMTEEEGQDASFRRPEGLACLKELFQDDGKSGDSLVTLEHQAEALAELIFQKNPEIVIISNELGCGVVPIDKADRLWREWTGRICSAIAARSEEVVRVVCGIGMRIK